MSDSNNILPSGTTGLNEESGKGLAISAFVLSLLGFLPFIGLLCIVTGIIIGIVVLAKHKNGKGFAIAAIIIGVVMILVQILVVIAVLAIYFRPSSLVYSDMDGNSIVASTFVLTAPFIGTGQRITSSGVDLEIRNGGGEDLVLNSIDFNVKSPSGAVCYASSGQTILVGQTAVFSSSCSGLKSGDNFNSDIKIIYAKTGGSIQITSSGIVSGKVSD